MRPSDTSDLLAPSDARSDEPLPTTRRTEDPDGAPHQLIVDIREAPQHMLPIVHARKQRISCEAPERAMRHAAMATLPWQGIQWDEIPVGHIPLPTRECTYVNVY